DLGANHRLLAIDLPPESVQGLARRGAPGLELAAGLARRFEVGLQTAESGRPLRLARVRPGQLLPRAQCLGLERARARREDATLDAAQLVAHAAVSAGERRLPLE